jgi:drug/metabolite transporter (DMT)-like permease
MAVAPIALILLSCFTHASWNLLARRRQGQELAFFRGMVMASVPISGVALIIAYNSPHAFPAVAFWCVLGSGAICGFYYYFLGLAYSQSDFTVVYPVARSLPVLILAFIEVVQGEAPPLLGWVGLVLVLVGCVMAPQVSYRGFDFKRYGARDILWIVLTAGTIVGFTKLDKIGAEAIDAVHGGPASAAIHCAFFHIFSCFSYLAVLAVTHRGRAAPPKIDWKLPALGGLLGYASYMLVLWAYQMAPQVSYLFAFRQFSIVLGVITAFAIYRERGMGVRLPAAAIIIVGLIVLKSAG